MRQVIELEAFVQKSVTEQLYIHCTATAETAFEIANRFKIDAKKVQVAALLHDVARSLDDKALLAEADRLGITPNEVEMKAPVLLHAKVGARIVQQQLRITDPEIIEAITVHTTGAAGMGRIARCLFVADYIKPTRNLPGVEHIRPLHSSSLDEAVRLVLREKVIYVLQVGQPISPDSGRLWNELASRSAAR